MSSSSYERRFFMTTTPKMGRVALGLLPIVLVPVAFLVAARWLKLFDEKMLSLAAAATAIFVVSYATYFAIRWQRGLDEVQKASGGFGGQWGTMAGTMAFVLLLVLPPFGDLATALVRDWSGDPGRSRGAEGCRTRDGVRVQLGVVLLQAIGNVVATAIWWMAKR